MEIENWIGNGEPSNSIPNPIPASINNRLIQASGFAGIGNNPDIPTGKIEAWIDSQLKLTVSHPLLIGARWAYYNGLYLILIFRMFYHSVSVGFVVDNPVYGGYNHFNTNSIVVYAFSSDIYGSSIIRPELYYELMEPLTWGINDISTENIPAPYILNTFSLTVALQNVQPQAINADILIQQLTGYAIPASFKASNSTWWFETGVIRGTSLYTANQFFGGSPHPYVGGMVLAPSLTEIESKAKKSRTSPLNNHFREYAIEIATTEEPPPCDIPIGIDPIYRERGYFCMSFGEYNNLMTTFPNIVSRINSTNSLLRGFQ